MVDWQSPHFDSLFIRLHDCSRFCSGCAAKVHQVFLAFNRMAPSYTLQITSNCSISPDFTNVWNLVRDQVLGPKVLEGTPLVPTTRFPEVVEAW